MLPFAIFLQHHNTFAIFLQHHNIFAIFLQHHNTFAIFLQHHNTFAINFATSDHKFPLRKSLSPSLRQTQPRKSRCLHQFEPCGNIKRSFASEGKYLPFHINCQFLKGFLCPTSSRVRKVDCRHSLAKATILKTDQLSGDTLALMKYICYFFFFFIICYLFHQLLYILLSAICCHQSTVGWWVSANMENPVTAAKKPTHCHWPLIKALTLFVFVFLEPLVKALTLCNLTLLRFRFTSHSLHC